MRARAPLWSVIYCYCHSWPLISGDGATDGRYATASKLAGSLLPEEHYTVDEKGMAIAITEAGTAYAEAALQV